jgi:hypothetical protein
MAEQISETMPAQATPCSQTASTLMAFIVACLTRPEIQTMAQEELDAAACSNHCPKYPACQGRKS